MTRIDSDVGAIIPVYNRPRLALNMPERVAMQGGCAG